MLSPPFGEVGRDSRTDRISTFLTFDFILNFCFTVLFNSVSFYRKSLAVIWRTNAFSTWDLSVFFKLCASPTLHCSGECVFNISKRKEEKEKDTVCVGGGMILTWLVGKRKADGIIVLQKKKRKPSHLSSQDEEKCVCVCIISRVDKNVSGHRAAQGVGG